METFLERERREKENVRLNKRKATPLSHMRGVFIVLTKLCAPSEL